MRKGVIVFIVLLLLAVAVLTIGPVVLQILSGGGHVQP